MSLPTSNYVLEQDFKIDNSKVLPAGSFVRPIRYYYVPKHIKDEYPWTSEEGTQTFCYTYYGIVAIPTEYIRKVGYV